MGDPVATAFSHAAMTPGITTTMVNKRTAITIAVITTITTVMAMPTAAITALTRATITAIATASWYCVGQLPAIRIANHMVVITAAGMSTTGDRGTLVR